ncbi:unnamed protein product [Protopolystoma xenopodis]|uniref:Uncharacterized protein n=1 Tax=Protopolystoma xenopodis TaxID=117903 RepID=A0A3S5B238_9PLAT|nr:unnamed protein product [Protopolystoma xenopodis]
MDGPSWLSFQSLGISKSALFLLSLPSLAGVTILCPHCFQTHCNVNPDRLVLGPDSSVRPADCDINEEVGSDRSLGSEKMRPILEVANSARVVWHSRLSAEKGTGLLRPEASRTACVKHRFVGSDAHQPDSTEPGRLGRFDAVSMAPSRGQLTGALFERPDVRTSKRSAPTCILSQPTIVTTFETSPRNGFKDGPVPSCAGAVGSTAGLLPLSPSSSCSSPGYRWPGYPEFSNPTSFQPIHSKPASSLLTVGLHRHQSPPTIQPSPNGQLNLWASVSEAESTVSLHHLLQLHPELGRFLQLSSSNRQIK